MQVQTTGKKKNNVRRFICNIHRTNIFFNMQGIGLSALHHRESRSRSSLRRRKCLFKILKLKQSDKRGCEQKPRTPHPSGVSFRVPLSASTADTSGCLHSNLIVRKDILLCVVIRGCAEGIEISSLSGVQQNFYKQVFFFFFFFSCAVASMRVLRHGSMSYLILVARIVVPQPKCML